ncbi:MAG: hypothetical protein CL570_06270 [Alphaproteobacteria bacterium]|nr:hypothetical protein [Alphaproteobacteria bacterium]HCQ71529.1 DUF2312 domain-containing protein [Rhodospirillaceae bacterium]|tara:strand:- start:4313 stop:4624 length:312 start_codon:yes stop_codon:yes gene_type:complete
MSENIANFPQNGEEETNTPAVEPRDVGGVAGQRLKAFIDRVERLEEEKKALAEDIKEVYAEAKGVGFDAKTIRKIVSLRKMEPEKRNEEEELLDLYKTAIGMI